MYCDLCIFASLLAKAYPDTPAQMVELVDTLLWGGSARKGVQVRILFWAPNKNPECWQQPMFGIFCFIGCPQPFVSCFIEALSPPEQTSRCWSKSPDLLLTLWLTTIYNTRACIRPAQLSELWSMWYWWCFWWSRLCDKKLHNTPLD